MENILIDKPKYSVILMDNTYGYLTSLFNVLPNSKELYFYNTIEINNTYIYKLKI